MKGKGVWEEGRRRDEKIKDRKNKNSQDRRRCLILFFLFLFPSDFWNVSALVYFGSEERRLKD